MPLNLVTTGNTILASDVNQLVQVLQRQSGQNETGHYWLGGWGNAANDGISCYIASLSRNATPTGAVIDTTDQAPSANLNNPITAHITQGGFQVYATTKAASTSESCGGVYTLSF